MKRLSFRFVRRLMLLLALVFPVVYLMGGFVAALAGSHGNVTLAQDDEVVTSSQIVYFNQLVRPSVSHTYIDSNTNWVLTVIQDRTFDLSHVYVVVTKVTSLSDNAKFRLRYPLVSDNLVVGTNVFYVTSPNSYDLSFQYASNDGNPISVVVPENATQAFDLTKMYGAGNEPTAEEFRSRYNADYYDYTLSTKIVEETTGTPTYSEYLFNQILGSDNIIKQWGYYALSDEEKGFAPFATLIKIVDDNFFHLGDSNDLGLFVYGYVYYALNIVAIYELVALVVMVFTIPLKLTDRFTKEM